MSHHLPSADARREGDLPRLLEIVRARPARRRRRRAALSLLSLSLLAAAALPLLRPRHAVTPPFARDTTPPVIRPAPIVELARAPAVRVERIQTSPDILGRLEVQPLTSVVRVDDADLQAALAAAQAPTGLIRVGGRTLWQGDLLASR